MKSRANMLLMQIYYLVTKIRLQKIDKSNKGQSYQNNKNASENILPPLFHIKIKNTYFKFKH